jgi:hypothetical protein
MIPYMLELNTEADMTKAMTRKGADSDSVMYILGRSAMRDVWLQPFYALPGAGEPRLGSVSNAWGQ